MNKEEAHQKTCEALQPLIRKIELAIEKQVAKGIFIYQAVVAVTQADIIAKHFQDKGFNVTFSTTVVYISW